MVVRWNGFDSGDKGMVDICTEPLLPYNSVDDSQVKLEGNSGA